MLIINELRHCPTRSDNVYFANNEQASLALISAFCSAHIEHKLTKLRAPTHVEVCFGVKFSISSKFVKNWCHIGVSLRGETIFAKICGIF